MKVFHFSGVSSSAKIASTGQAGTQAPQSMHSSGWMKSCCADSKSGSSFRGWMQSTGQTSTHAVSFVPTQGAVLLGLGAAVVAQAPQGDWRDAREFLPLFAPSGARAAAYRIYVSPRDLH